MTRIQIPTGYWLVTDVGLIALSIKFTVQWDF